MRLLIILAIAGISAFSPASAQVRGATGPTPLGFASPLGIGPAAPATPPGIPLGATELASPGISPTTAAPGSAGCSGPGNLTSGTSSTALFDGGVTAATSSADCGPTPPSFAQPTASASSPTGMVLVPFRTMQVPLGATELGSAGVSPPPSTGAAPAEGAPQAPSSSAPTVLGTSAPCVGPIDSSGSC
jgi:hypothetical protein